MSNIHFESFIFNNFIKQLYDINTKYGINRLMQIEWKLDKKKDKLFFISESIIFPDFSVVCSKKNTHIIIEFMIIKNGEIKYFDTQNVFVDQVYFDYCNYL